MDFDLLYLSELDPTWNNGELAFFTNPEAAWLANPVAQSACLIDGAAATAGSPSTSCSGAPGPGAGCTRSPGTRAPAAAPKETSLWAARSLAALHRRGLARRTMGNDALCGAPIATFLPKTQYKLSMFFPLPETTRGHVIGESTLRWGMGRSIPAVGEDHLYILWRWNDCCAVVF